jgi:hypothetical protein
MSGISGRRDFLKTAAIGAAGAMGLSALKLDKVAAQSTGGWVNGMAINPAIDNKRVICCHDTKMLTATPANSSWANQTANVDDAVVASNLDQMAVLLTQKATAADAWSTIFRSSKPWSSTRVAMKTNGIGGNTTNRPRPGIYKKICDVLVGLGVQPSNIVLFDACDNATSYYSSFMSLTDSTKIRAVMSTRASNLGGFKTVPLTNAQNISCPADLVDGNIDILVNVAACTSHNGTGGHYSYGSCTLCMKNHFGTFTSGTQAQHSGDLHVGNSAASPPPTPLALFEINKHSAILGGNPVPPAAVHRRCAAIQRRKRSRRGLGQPNRPSRHGHLCSHRGLSFVQQDPSRHNHHGQLSHASAGSDQRGHHPSPISYQLRLCRNGRAGLD